jgi:UDP-N-acetylmuramate dehydrogenase
LPVLQADRSLASLTTLRIGGPCDLYAEVHSVAALAALLERCAQHGVGLMTVGQGANLLVPDGGIRGVVQRLRGAFRQVEVEGDLVRAGAGVVVPQLARTTVRAGKLGLEALGGFPASLGGAIVMNAGCYGTEICELLEEVVVLFADGRTERLCAADLEPSYRSTNLRQRESIVLEATLRLVEGDAARGERRLDELNKRRWSSLPSGKPSAGSIFKNPPAAPAGRLIEEVGLKGARHGQAAISHKHANVIVNLGGARAADVMQLMAEARSRVLAERAIELEPELLMLGELAVAWQEAARRDDPKS